MANEVPEICWVTPEGEPVSCIEKLKVLRESISELRQATQDVFEDAILIGCDERQVREVLAGLIERLENPYRKTSSAG